MRKEEPPFHICLIEVLRTIQNLWSKSSLPSIGQKSDETKLMNLITDHAKANTINKMEIPKLELVKLNYSIFAHASVFKSVAAVLLVTESRFQVRSSMTVDCYYTFIYVYYLPTELEFLRDKSG